MKKIKLILIILFNHLFYSYSLYSNTYIDNYYYLEKVKYYDFIKNYDSLNLYLDSISNIKNFTPQETLEYATIILTVKNDTNVCKKLVLQSVCKGAEYSWISNNKVLAPLFTKSDSIYFTNTFNQTIKSFNTNFYCNIFSMYNLDQFIRLKYLRSQKDTLLKGTFLNLMKEVDSMNFIKINQYLLDFGWINNYQVEKYFFPVFLHVTSQKLKTIEDFKKFEKIVFNEVLNGNLCPSTYAVWIDRFYVFNLKQKEIYGTFWEFKDDKRTLSKVYNAKNIDKRRKKIGLGSLKEYCLITERELPKWYK